MILRRRHPVLLRTQVQVWGSRKSVNKLVSPARSSRWQNVSASRRRGGKVGARAVAQAQPFELTYTLLSLYDPTVTESIWESWRGRGGFGERRAL